MRGKQLGMTTRSRRLWTWSGLEFCGDVLEETFGAVTWGLHSTRSNFRIADSRYMECLLFVGMVCYQ